MSKLYDYSINQWFFAENGLAMVADFPGEKVVKIGAKVLAHALMPPATRWPAGSNGSKITTR
jgi:hypothetical protein